MHEFALAENIIETIVENVKDNFADITEINIDVGVFAGVVSESLKFGLELIIKEKGASNITVNINDLPAVARCECGKKYETRDMFESCPECRSFNRSIVSGSDVIINSVEIRDG